MKNQTLTISLSTEESVSAILSRPEGQCKTGIVIAHGAANDMHNPLIKAVAEGLAKDGIACLRFNFLYREKQKKSVDPEHRLVLAWKQAINCMAETCKPEKIIAMGKSLGARIAAQATAENQVAPDRLIFLGYPLHAPGKKDRLRDAPLYKIEQPMLFFEGTRDPFCDLALLDKVLKKVKTRTHLEIIDNGNHSFELPKSNPRPQEDIFEQIIAYCNHWIREDI